MNAKQVIAAATAKPGLSADRKAAVWIGVLYIIGTVGMVVTNAVLSGPAYLAQVAAEPNRVALGALFLLLPGLALAMVPVVFWPVGKRYNETLAMGYVVLAVWLIAKGFNQTAIAAESVGATSKWQPASSGSAA